MNSNTIKRRIILIGIGALLLMGAIMGLSALNKYLDSVHTVSIELRNVSSGSLKTMADIAHSDEPPKEIRAFGSDSFSVRLSKNQAYKLEYTAADGYASGDQVIQPGEKSVFISPDISESRKKALLTESRDDIIGAIVSVSAKIPELYTIDFDNGKLLNKGEWFVTTLSYKGSALDAMSDVLVVAVNRKDSTWKAANPPAIIMTKVYTRDIPQDVMETANELRQQRAFEVIRSLPQ